MRIDPHVHCRDGNQNYKDTIKHVFKVCDEQGVDKIFDMPNTSPPILNEKDVIERLNLVPQDVRGRYHLYIGATSNQEQLQEAVRITEKYNEVIGIKFFAGKSVGDLAIISEDKQRLVYKTLAENNYKGVIALHCEKESFIDNNMFNPDIPITHAYSIPTISEVQSIKDQISFAKEANFKGTLHICHVSCSESVNLINSEKDLKITCAVTPHHVLWDESMLAREDGLLYKMNPPLRKKEEVNSLRDDLAKGKIDWIETDHASHAIGEKLFSPYMSGFPSLYLYKIFVEEYLPTLGLSTNEIDKLTYDNIIKTFKI